MALPHHCPMMLATRRAMENHDMKRVVKDRLLPPPLGHGYALIEGEVE